MAMNEDGLNANLTPIPDGVPRIISLEKCELSGPIVVKIPARMLDEIDVIHFNGKQIDRIEIIRDDSGSEDLCNSRE